MSSGAQMRNTAPAVASPPVTARASPPPGGSGNSASSGSLGMRLLVIGRRIRSGGPSVIEGSSDAAADHGFQLPGEWGIIELLVPDL